MGYVVWILQFLLAFAFVATGAMKIVTPRDKLSERMAWAGSISPGFIKLVGAIEVLGGLALFLPPILPVVPTVLTMVAAGCLSLLMAGAIALHVRRKEAREAMPAIVMLILLILLIFGLFAVDRF